MRGLRWFTIALVILIIILFSLIGWIAHLYTDWLWFKSLNYQKVFTTILLSEIGLRFAVGLLAFILLLINLLVTRKALVSAAQTPQSFEEDGVVTLYPYPWSKYINYRILSVIFIVISGVMAIFFSLAVTGDWITLQKFLKASPFGVTDPIFHKDIGFYVFHLPFYDFIYKLINWLVILIAFWVALAYFLSSVVTGNTNRPFQSIDSRCHLCALASIFFIVRACGYYLQQYTLLYSEQGAVYGPGYTDIHANLLAYKVMFFLALIVAITILINIFTKRFRLVLYSIGFLVVASIVLNVVYPALMQKLIVLPNEMGREKPYIENNIKYTRMAYNLNRIERKSFPAGHTLTIQDLRRNQDTVRNIRLWDYRPLQKTYSQLQEIRTYYEFKDIDVDRYIIDGQYRQVMVSARELNQALLPEQAKTWVNQHLKYTHGYGITMSPVNEVTTEGLPRFLIKDIPPTTLTNLKVQRPEIYFGELTDNYVIVNTRSQEFDYPMGDQNAWCTYQGKNGVQINSIFRRLLFALTFKDYKLFLSGEITNNSQILYYRNIHERVPKIAPFLFYDHDPYIVLSEGNLYWVWDAYTVSDMYPYSEPFKGRLNYIRNSVKVVVDAYTGMVTFYVTEPDEPITKTYKKIFPDLFVPASEMPDELKNHIRYPEDLFMIQSKKYIVYHMENYRVFYNKEDKWNLPKELFGAEEQQMEPYYIIVKLPGEERPEFIQIMPFTPQNKNNMIAWLAGRSDVENYGKLLVYEFPKQELVFGPMQIEARIDQNTYISQRISLWDQRGSQVIRGNLLVIPIKDALIYVEPLYLQAEQSRMPELRRVIVAHGDHVVMEPSLEEALQKIFGQEEIIYTDQPKSEEKQESKNTLSQLIQKANKYYNEAQEELRKGNWTGYGNALEKLKATLDELATKTR